MTIERPRFLDEDLPVAAPDREPVPEPLVAAERMVTPVLLDAEPDAPAKLRAMWQPQDLPNTPLSTPGRSWIALGVTVVIVGLALASTLGMSTAPEVSSDRAE